MEQLVICHLEMSFIWYLLFSTATVHLQWLWMEQGGTCSGCENKQAEDQCVVNAQAMAGEKKATWKKVV